VVAEGRSSNCCGAGPDHEILNGIIETLMRIDANVQKLLYDEEDDGEEAS